MAIVRLALENLQTAALDGAHVVAEVIIEPQFSFDKLALLDQGCHTLHHPGPGIVHVFHKETLKLMCQFTQQNLLRSAGLSDRSVVGQDGIPCHACASRRSEEETGHPFPGHQAPKSTSGPENVDLSIPGPYLADGIEPWHNRLMGRLS
ncbi:MAG: hypothetical protein O7H41_21470 [Planctomycetota bacterium]|nr:hypothetical protein [Planctomycetota bacterium]